jgi:hypothetical protein
MLATHLQSVFLWKDHDDISVVRKENWRSKAKEHMDHIHF